MAYPSVDHLLQSSYIYWFPLKVMIYVNMLCPLVEIPFFLWLCSFGFVSQ